MFGITIVVIIIITSYICLKNVNNMIQNMKKETFTGFRKCCRPITILYNLSLILHLLQMKKYEYNNDIGLIKQGFFVIIQRNRYTKQHN